MGIFNFPLSGLAVVLLLVSLCQGVAVATLVYMVKHERANNKRVLKDVGGTGVVGVLSLLGLGCAACGTSLVTPLLTFFFATSSAAVADVVGFYTAIVALIVSVITLYLSGVKLAPRLRLDAEIGQLYTK